jgi:hypothetical protein
MSRFTRPRLVGVRNCRSKRSLQAPCLSWHKVLCRSYGQHAILRYNSSCRSMYRHRDLGDCHQRSVRHKHLHLRKDKGLS